MALRKKAKILSIQICKAIDSDDSDYYKYYPVFSNAIKLPFVRTYSNCSTCALSESYCNTWKLNIKIVGLISDHGGYHKCECRNTPMTEYKFNYMVPFEVIRKYIPVDVLVELGIYKEPKNKKF